MANEEINRDRRKIFLIQHNFATVEARDLHFALVLDRDIGGCFLEFKDTKLELRKIP